MNRYMVISDQHYRDLASAMGEAAFRHYLAERAVADAARQWWRDYTQAERQEKSA